MEGKSAENFVHVDVSSTCDEISKRRNEEHCCIIDKPSKIPNNEEEKTKTGDKGRKKAFPFFFILLSIDLIKCLSELLLFLFVKELVDCQEFLPLFTVLNLVKAI